MLAAWFMRCLFMTLFASLHRCIVAQALVMKLFSFFSFADAASLPWPLSAVHAHQTWQTYIAMCTTHGKLQMPRCTLIFAGMVGTPLARRPPWLMCMHDGHSLLDEAHALQATYRQSNTFSPHSRGHRYGHGLGKRVQSSPCDQYI